MIILTALLVNLTRENYALFPMQSNPKGSLIPDNYTLCIPDCREWIPNFASMYSAEFHVHGFRIQAKFELSFSWIVAGVRSRFLQLESKIS